MASKWSAGYTKYELHTPYNVGVVRIGRREVHCLEVDDSEIGTITFRRSYQGSPTEFSIRKLITRGVAASTAATYSVVPLDSNGVLDTTKSIVLIDYDGGSLGCEFLGSTKIAFYALGHIGRVFRGYVLRDAGLFEDMFSKEERIEWDKMKSIQRDMQESINGIKHLGNRELQHVVHGI